MEFLKQPKERILNQTQDLMSHVFEKAKNDSNEVTPNGICVYLMKELNEKIKERNLTKYYNGYILDNELERTKPTKYNLDVLSNYLGFENFEEFVAREEKEKKKRKLRRKLFLCRILSFVLLISLLVFILKYYKKNCMIWVDDHYEKIRCSGLDNEKKLDEVVLKKFRKIDVCKDSTFFKDGEAIIHYTRHNNIVDFFTDDGEHPIFDNVYTDPITRTIINSRVRPCDSINTN
ncbi:hypothetical protein [Winogradskyella haliclonae]|uniref:Uncharacterized protein n=1 Tax=Winogradskyella haliclonae TaxID=2048558 RepID=A0ABQ2BYX8_9FLAO|nr:hypothetical protein [Winogradskyella haliclonae]GGI56983.1 hypothetical protein GCM10011444_12920 [Winogradskyella haliclonae]